MSDKKQTYHFADMRDKLLYDALVQYQKACQEQVRALGMMMAVMRMKTKDEKYIAVGIIDQNTTDICRCNQPVPYDNNPTICSLCTSHIVNL